MSLLLVPPQSSQGRVSSCYIKVKNAGFKSDCVGVGELFQEAETSGRTMEEIVRNELEK